MQAGNMTLSEFYVMEGVVMVLILLLEAPSGACADKFGRKVTILFGVVSFFFGFLWFVLMQNTVDVWCANILISIGFAFSSGADEALLRDSLATVNREHEYKRILGRAFSNRLLVVAVCSLLAGLLAQVSIRLPMYSCLPGVIALCIIALFFHEPPVKEIQHTTVCTLLRESASALYTNKALWWATCFLFLIGSASQLWFFSYNPYFALVGLDVGWYGIIFASLNLVAWYFSKNAYKIAKRMNDAHTYAIMVASVSIPMLVMGTFVETWAVSMVLFQNFSRGVLKPFISDLTNTHTVSQRRATVLSTQSAVCLLGHCFSLFVFSWIVDVYQVPHALQILGVATLVFGVIGMCKYYSHIGK